MTAESVIKHAKLVFTRHCTMTVADNEPQCNYHKLKMILQKTMLQLWGKKLPYNQPGKEKASTQVIKNEV